MKKPKKFVTISEYFEKIKDDPRFKEKMNEIKKKREESPARHEKKYDSQTFQLDMSLKSHCLAISIATPQLHHLSKLYQRNSDLADDTQLKENHKKLYDYIKDNVRSAANALAQLEARVAELDQAIIDEDNAKMHLSDSP